MNFPVIGHPVAVLVCHRRRIFDFFGVGTLQIAVEGPDHEVAVGPTIQDAEGTGGGGSLPVGLAEIIRLTAFSGEYPIPFGGGVIGIPAKRNTGCGDGGGCPYPKKGNENETVTGSSMQYVYYLLDLKNAPGSIFTSDKLTYIFGS